MALKRSLDKTEFSSLDAGLKAQYVERDGKYLLEVDDSPALSALQSERDKVKALEAQLAGFGNMTPEQVKALNEGKAKAEREKDFASGNFEKILAEERAKHAKDLELRDAREKGLRTTVESALIDAEATRAIVEHGGNPALLLPIIKGRTRLETVGDREVAVVIGEKGGPRLKTGAQKADDYMPINEFVAEMKSDKTYAGAFAANLGSGTRGPARPVTTASQAASDAMNRAVEALKGGATSIGAEV